MRRGSAGLVAAVVLCNIAAHFLPFERASIGSDDFAHWTVAQDLSLADIAARAPRQPDRPLTFAFLMLQERWMGGHADKGLWLMVVLTSAVAIMVLVLLQTVFRDRSLAFLGTLIFIALPHKLEVYHIPVYAAYDVANLLYIMSVIAFLFAVQRNSPRAIYLSLAAYSAGLLFYETGFFLPVVLIAYAWLYHRRFVKRACLCALPAALYVTFRFTRAFGWAEATLLHDHHADAGMLLPNLLDLAHHYAGRYLARNVLYGVYNFFHIETPWLLAILGVNVVIVALLVRWSRRVRLNIADRASLVLAGLLFGWCVLPILLTSYGGVGGRQLVLPSIGVAIVVTALLARAQHRWRLLFIPALVCALVVCQGNAWTQVVACRINGAVYASLQARQQSLRAAERIVIDTKSFADNIPFTWIQRDFNVLNTYYGAQTFESWGLASMVRVVLGPHEAPIYIVAERPQAVGQDAWRIGMLEQTRYRAATMRHETVPRRGTLVIGFQEVYGDQFRHGRRMTN